jgi:hypothetical protein
MVPALESTLEDLGIDLNAQENVTLDLEERPNKSPRAFCAPIEVPDRVVLVIQPIGGPDDWRALFHEGGHTEHFAHTSRNLSMEEKRLGDNAVTEGWAMLLQHLIDSGFYVSSYLRSWAFEAQLRAFLKEKFGSKWFASREAGSLLRELWGEGQKMRAEEMLKEVTGYTLEMESVAERVREVLR